jgi:hypothetical protein
MTGEGTAVIDGGAAHVIVEVDVQLVTKSILVEDLTTTFPRKVLRAGWYGFTVQGNPIPFSDPLSPYMTWWKYLDFEQEAAQIAPLGIFGDTLQWSFGGSVANLCIYW